MKKFNLITLLFLVVSFTILAVPVGSKFSYQGQLQEAGSSVSGVYDMIFSLHNDSGSTTAITFNEINDVVVTSGLFSVELDFGDLPFDGQEYYLEIKVKQDLALAFSLLVPMQRINTVPYAIQSAFVENSSSAWIDAFSGIQHNGEVVIGNLVADAGDTVQIVSDAGDSPLRVIVDTVGTRFRVSKNGGVGVGNNYNDSQIPDNGLLVRGQASQQLSSHGFVKAGTFIECGAGISSGSVRYFNNVDSSGDFSTSPTGAGGNCIITTPFDISNVFYVVSAEHPGGPFESRTASCTSASSSTLACQINQVSSAGVTHPNGVLQILFY